MGNNRLYSFIIMIYYLQHASRSIGVLGVSHHLIVVSLGSSQIYTTYIRIHDKSQYLF